MSSGSGTPFTLLLNGELITTARAPAARWPRSAPLPSIPSAWGSRNLPVQSTTSVTPYSRQGISLGSRACRRTMTSLPWILARPLASSTTCMSRCAAAAAEPPMQRPVGAVLAEVLEYRLQGGTHRASDVDHEGVEVVVSQVVPEGQLADAAKSVDSQRPWSSHHRDPFSFRRPSLTLPPRSSRLQRVACIAARVSWYRAPVAAGGTPAATALARWSGYGPGRCSRSARRWRASLPS